jgi:hypothetical protein
MIRRSTGFRRRRARPAVQRQSRARPVVIRRRPVRAKRRPLKKSRRAHARPAIFRPRSRKLRPARRRLWLRRRRPALRRYRWWDRGYPFLIDWGPYPITGTGAPLGRGLSNSVRRSLLRKGLLDGIWRRRLVQASPEIIRFVNRFHRVTGLERVLEDLFSDKYRRAAARMAIRLSHRLANDDPDFVQNLYYDRRLSHVLDSGPTLTVAVGYRGLHYLLMPLQRLRSTALLRQLRCDMRVFGSPGRVRWTFCRNLKSSKGGLIASLRRLLSKEDEPAVRRWLAALKRIVVTV